MRRCQLEHRRLGALPPPIQAAIVLFAATLSCGPPPAERFVGPALPGTDERLDGDARAWVERTLSSLSLREKVGQLVFVWIPGGYASTSSGEFAELERKVVEGGIGGVAISVGLPHAYAAKLNALQKRARVPLLVASDFESGGPGMRLGGVYALPYLLDLGGGTMFPPTMAFGAIGEESFAYELGRITGLEARAVGVHLTFAPVLDVNSNPENPIINTRSFGEDPQLVARLGVAFIRGARAAELLTTGKHYPGHGDTRTDSHIDLPAVTASRARLDSVELVPFKRGVAAGVDAMMTAHIAAPAILGPDAPPATLSPYFLEGILRTDLGFRGVIFTDALRMGAIINRYGAGEAAVLALEAGADVLLAPADERETIVAVIDAVDAGRLSETRIDAALRRVLELKARAGLHRGRRVDSENITSVVGSSKHRAFADSAAARSITLPRDRAGLLPIDAARTRRVLSLTFAGRDLPLAGRAFDRMLASALDSLASVWLNEDTGEATYDSLAAWADSVELVLLSLYVSPRAGAGGVAIPAVLVEFVRDLSDAGRPLVVLSFGSPYLLSSFPEVGTYVLAWGGADVSQRAAARALLGLSPISGRLPISLPPWHFFGDGLQRAAIAPVLHGPDRR
ncbi:MAG: hypothetical protein JSU87_10670 [Gemmatimonadota bacterium]|nr:MAG: hypothetical protein JSU87_10670 [Gemmatimonadota bacterium]